MCGSLQGQHPLAVAGLLTCARLKHTEPQIRVSSKELVVVVLLLTTQLNVTVVSERITVRRIRVSARVCLPRTYPSSTKILLERVRSGSDHLQIVLFSLLGVRSTTKITKAGATRSQLAHLTCRTAFVRGLIGRCVQSFSES